MTNQEFAAEVRRRIPEEDNPVSKAHLSMMADRAERTFEKKEKKEKKEQVAVDPEKLRAENAVLKKRVATLEKACGELFTAMQTLIDFSFLTGPDMKPEAPPTLIGVHLRTPINTPMERRQEAILPLVAEMEKLMPFHCTLPCGHVVEFEHASEIPFMDVACPCGDPTHWVVKCDYWKTGEEAEDGSAEEVEEGRGAEDAGSLAGDAGRPEAEGR